MEEINASGEFVTAMALADPASSTLYGWSPEGHLRTDGPYAETKEQLAGFFLIDCATRERAEEIAAHFAQPGGTIELRPSMWGDGDDGDAARDSRTRTCGGRPRRTSSRRCCASTATSRRARTPSRRRCSPPPASGRTRACPTTRSALADPGRARGG